MERMAMNDATADLNAMLAAYGLAPISGPLLDVPYRSPDVVFQSGVPGFAYPRRNPNPKVRFVGALLPYQASIARPFPHPEKLSGQRPVILISQGTVDNKDPGKLMVPALEALTSSGALLVVATGHSKTAELRRAYPQHNVIIEDYVDFAHVLDHADLLICNGGYGSILLSLSHGVPVLSAGVREGKNDVNAHVDYFGVGIDLRTESPTPADIARGAAQLLSGPRWKQRVARLREEFEAYRPHEIIAAYLANAVSQVYNEPLTSASQASRGERV
jgi:UDP:flavonoid glycosyltransferase YjiC (YdhE family)